MERATNAEQAVLVINKTEVHLILMDIELPGTDGLTLTRMLKADQATKHIPIVALTAFAIKGDVQIALKAGCIGYITKPIDTRTLKTQLEEFLRADNLKKGEHA